jgi:hypothetical protein
MFVLRSAFWLTIGFLVISPHDTSIGAVASTLKDQAIAAGVETGKDLLVQQVLADASTKLFPNTPSAALPMQDLPAAPFVFPRPRPAAMG